MCGGLSVIDQDFYGVDAVEITVDDNGNSGSGGPLLGSCFINVTVLGLNDAPQVFAPLLIVRGLEDTLVTFQLNVSDVDAGDSSLLVQLQSINATLFLGDTGAGGHDDCASVVFINNGRRNGTLVTVTGSQASASFLNNILSHRLF